MNVRAARRWLAVVGLVFATGFATNFLWEVLQSPLFAPMGSTLGEGMWRCFRAGLGDGVIILLIAAAVGFLLGRRDWFLDGEVTGYLLATVFGSVFAVAIEWSALRSGRWSYRSSMPVIPGIGVGLVPVIQMTLLPILAYRIAALWLRRPRFRTVHR